MSTIKVVCIDQTLAFNNTPVITSGGLNEDFVSFTFCALWSGFTRTAVFWRNEKEVYHQTLDAEDRCQIPPEVTGEDGVIYFGVFGVNAKGVQRTSEVLNYRIHKGAITTGTKPSNPTPDIYTQILARCQDVKDEVAVERSRINNLIKLEEGSTTGDAELADIRVGYEGTVHTTAGYAVRNQVSSIERRLSSVVKYVSGAETVELICHSDGYYGTTGLFTKADGAAKYAVVKNVLSGDKYVFDTYLNDPAIPALVYFNANGEFVGYEKTGTGEDALVHHTVVIPDGVTRIVLQSVDMSDNFPRLSIVDRVLELSSYTKAESDAKYGAELQDIRKGVDDTIYETAGEAVRLQIGELKRYVDEKTEVIVSVPAVIRKNLFNVDAVTIGGWANTDNGKIETYPDNPYVQNHRFSDYIPVTAGEKYTYSGGAVGYTILRSYVWYNSQKEFISSVSDIHQGKVVTLTVPDGAAYIIINFQGDEYTHSVQFEKGEAKTEYEEYIPDSELVGYYLPDLLVRTSQVDGLDEKFAEIDEECSELPLMQEQIEAVSNKTDALNPVKPGRKNLIDMSAIQMQCWARTTDGKLEGLAENQYLGGYCRTDYVPVTPGETYVFNDFAGTSGPFVRSYVYYDSNKAFVSSATHETSDKTIVLPVPENAAYVIFNGNVSIAPYAKLQLEKGTTPTEYEEYIPDSELVGYYLPDLLVRTSQVEGLDEKIAEITAELTKTPSVLCLPEKYDLVVGDTFELFYKGILNVIDTGVYDLEFTFSDGGNRGKAWKRKYEYTPAASDVGKKILTIVARGNDGDEVDRKSVTLNIVNKPTTPASKKTVLCIGDSLTESGVWCHELHRRLTASDGSPVGFGLSNIDFIGTCNKDGTRYEGYGGWTFGSYNGASKSDKFVNIYGTFEKTESDQHSVYSDDNGVRWKLETIGASKIKIIRVSAAGTLPNSGTLAWVSGGVNTGSIVFTSSEQASGNPFWNETAGANDFATYAGKFGVSTIDHVIILLGWNSTNSSEDSYKTAARAFIDSLRGDFPNCKITLCGLQVPSRGGFANNYGITWKYYDKLQFVWKLAQWYEDLSKEYSNMEFVQISGQFDTEYNMATTNISVNTRNSATEKVGSNGVHPTENGYLQIADAVLRNICTKI